MNKVKWTPEQSAGITLHGVNLIVSAGAGSGKTAVLSERVVYKISQGINVNEILILTFAKAAAAEMKERIRKKIASNPLYIKQLPLLDVSYITTFDAFTLAIVNKYHYVLNIKKKISICPNTVIEIAKKELLDEIFDKHYELALTKNNPAFTKLIKEYCKKNDQSLKNFILTTYNKLDLLLDMNEYLETYEEKYYNETYLTKLNSLFEENYTLTIKEYRVILEDIINIIDNEKAKELGQYTKRLYSKVNYDELPQILNDIKAFRFPNNTKNKYGTIYNELRDKVKAKLEELSIILEMGDVKTRNDNYLKTRSNTKTICQILLEFNQAITNYKLNYNLYTYNDIEKMAINLVKDHLDIREEIKSSFKEIMIDEYQDTSDLQETFIGYISKQNVYMVGDIKQSIYGFRNANPLIFQNQYLKSTDYLKIDQSINKKIDLNKNFRSRSDVLEGVNMIFKQIMTTELGGIDYRQGHEMYGGNLVFENKKRENQNYQIELLDLKAYDEKDEVNDCYKVSEKEAFALVNDIKRRLEKKEQVLDNKTGELRDLNYGDFAILLSTSTPFELYKRIFESQGIPLKVNKNEEMKNSFDLKIILNLMKMIWLIKQKNDETKEFKYLFTSIARSYLINYDDKIIYDCLINNTYKEQALYKKAYEIANQIDELTNEELITLIFDKFTILEQARHVARSENIRYEQAFIMDLGKELNEMGIYFAGFVKHLEKVVSNKIKIEYEYHEIIDNTVKLMTIHASKGLEFPVCYFADLNRKFRKVEITSKYTYDDEMGLIVPYQEDGLKVAVNKIIYEKKVTTRFIAECIRLWYVALTRAKEKLVVLYHGANEETTKEPLKWNNYHDLMAYCKSKLIYLHHPLKLGELELSKDYLSLSKKQNLETLKGEKIIVNNDYLNKIIIKDQGEISHYAKKPNIIDETEKAKMEMGIKIHEYLEALDFLDPELFKTIDELIKEPYYNNKIKKFFNNTLIKDLKDAKVYQEYAFINHDIEGIIDLMLEYDDKIILVDYKLKNIIDKAYLKQIKGYQEYIEMLTSKPVKAYLYSIIEEEFKEIV